MNPMKMLPLEIWLTITIIQKQLRLNMVDIKLNIIINRSRVTN